MQRYVILLSLLAISSLSAVKVIERIREPIYIPPENRADGRLLNPHIKSKMVCADRDAFATSIIGKPLQEIFSRIYEENYLLSSFTHCGFWATTEATRKVRNHLYPICLELGVTTLLDVGCGDYYWMQIVDLGDIKYIGIDIVPQIISLNRQYFKTVRCNFFCLDATKDLLPKVDLILCRDVLTELCMDDALAVLRSCKASGACYLLATMHPAVKKNYDHHSGLHGQYNLMLPPFNFPEPILYIDEFSDIAPQSWFELKDLCLWKLDDIEL